MKKINSCLVVLLLMSVSFMANAQDYPRGDVSQDGAVNVADVSYLINYLLTGTWPDEVVTQGDWVDLGLPSGTLWATRNVGADRPEDYGDYFAWGETEPKDVYNWDTYKWCVDGDTYSLTKYCRISNYGFNGYTDDRTELDPEDDAAYVNMGPSWRTPTIQQLDELNDECTWTWTQLNGVNGRLVTGPNGNSIFLPAAGARNGESLNNAGIWGALASRTLGFSDPRFSFFMGFNEEDIYSWGSDYRYFGSTVRAVRISNE